MSGGDLYNPAAEEEAKKMKYKKEAAEEAVKRNAARPFLKKIFGAGKVNPDDVEREIRETGERKAREEELRCREEERRAAEKKQNMEEEAHKAAEEHKLRIEAQKAKEERIRAEEQRRIDVVVTKAVEYVDKMKINGKDTIKELSAELDLSSRSGNVEGVLGKLLKAENLEAGSKVPELVESLAELWASEQKTDMPHWLHSVCHFFENYTKSKRGDKDPGPSFLGDRRWSGAAGIMTKEVLSRAADVGRYSLHDKYNRYNLSRVFKPLLEYNLDEVDVANLETFPLKPEHPDYLVVADQQSGGDGEEKLELSLVIKEFFRASSPKDLVLRLIRVGEPLPMHDKTKAMSLLFAVKDDVTPDQMNNYLNKAYPVNNQPTDLKTLETNVAVAREAKEKVAGLFVDVDGTLIIDGKMNAVVLQAMEKAVGQGVTVTVFTGGSPEAALGQLTALGVPKQFLNVEHKADYMGKVLEWLIDDTDAELQGFKTPQYHQYSPDNADMINFSREDDDGKRG